MIDTRCDCCWNREAAWTIEGPGDALDEIWCDACLSDLNWADAHGHIASVRPLPNLTERLNAEELEDALDDLEV